MCFCCVTWFWWQIIFMIIYRPGPQDLNGKTRLWPRVSYQFRSARNGWSPCLSYCLLSFFSPFITPYSILKVVWAPDHILISKDRIDSILPPAGFLYDTMPDYGSVRPIRVLHEFKQPHSSTSPKQFQTQISYCVPNLYALPKFKWVLSAIPADLVRNSRFTSGMFFESWTMFLPSSPMLWTLIQILQWVISCVHPWLQGA